MMDDGKTILFEKTPVPRAVMQLAVPTILSSLVMVIYNLADTYFVGMMNNPVQNAAVTLAAPVLLAFNAVNNLFGVGSSSMMSRALGRRDYEAVRRSSAFGFYCALFFGVLFSALCTIGLHPPADSPGGGCQYNGCNGRIPEMDRALRSSPCHPQCGHGVFGALRGFIPSRQHRNHERLSA